MNGYVSIEGRPLPAQPDPGQQLEVEQLVRLYRTWQEEVFTAEVVPDLKQLVAEAARDPAAQDHLVSELSGYLAMVALDSDAESPLAAYNHAQAAALERAKTISPKLSKLGILNNLLDAAIESTEAGEASTRPVNEPGVTDIKDYRNRPEAPASEKGTPETDEENNRQLERIVAVLQSPEADRRDRDEAFAVVVKQYTPMLLAHIYRITRSRHMAQDILQEVFLNAVLEIGKLEYRGDKAFKGWLYKSALNRTLNIVRTGPYKASKTRLTLDENLGLPPSFSATEQRANPETSFEHKETIRELGEVLNGLLPHEKAAIIMYEAGYSYEQIGAELGKTVGSIKSLLGRGREKLNARMEERLNPSLVLWPKPLPKKDTSKQPK